MPFVPLLKGPPFEIKLTHSEDRKEITAGTILAGDEAASAISSVCCRLSVLSRPLDSYWELSFFLRIVSIDRGDFEPFETQDREEASQYKRLIATHRKTPYHFIEFD
jgi:hypothetical protein